MQLSREQAIKEMRWSFALGTLLVAVQIFSLVIGWVKQGWASGEFRRLAWIPLTALGIFELVRAFLVRRKLRSNAYPQTIESPTREQQSKEMRWSFAVGVLISAIVIVLLIVKGHSEFWLVVLFPPIGLAILGLGYGLVLYRKLHRSADNH
jgi:peptidoglycan/LPS O-acetylase OafA/YrhL